MNFISRFLGTFFDPRRTFAALAEKPVWVDALIVLLIVVTVFSYLIAPYQRQDSVKLIEDSAAKMKQRFGEEGYNRALERAQSSSLARTLVLPPVFLLVGFLFSSLIILGLGRLTSTQGNYVQVFSALLHANFVDKILGNAVRLALILSRKSVVQTTISLAAFFPKLEVTSVAYIILAQFDFFQLWLFGILGLGLASIFKISARKAMVISYGFWLLKSALYVGLGLLSSSFLR
jgi:hypothetical protein